MAIQLRDTFANSIAQKILDDVSSVKLVFTDASEIFVTSLGKELQHDATNHYYIAVFYISFSSADAKTLDKIEFYSADNVLLFEDVGLSKAVPAGDITLLEKVEVSYVA